MITAGVESGAQNTKVVIVQDRQIKGKAKVLTGFDPPGSARKALEKGRTNAGCEPDQPAGIGVTGSGKDSVNIGTVRVNDIKAMAKAATFFFQKAGTVIDVGLEESRVAKLDASGRVLDFAINEKCAAGSGSFLEVMARALELDLQEMGALALQSDREIPLNTQCVVFAESEVVGLIHALTDKKDICRSIHDALAARTVSLIRRIGLSEDLVIVGGLGRNIGFTEAIQRELMLDMVYVPEEPEFGPALGAALIARELSPES